ncbi:MAG: hypothetical protein BroJett013_30650 [Alphaproteobacteria bacterium]|nr:MAG: hypothetical protein BroJett013_30650 [Alphaproteobacteria bacterium]
MKRVCVFALVCASAIAFVDPAAAAEIAWGDRVAEAGDALKPIVDGGLTVVITGILLKYAGPFGMFIRQQYVSELVSRATDYAFGATFGAQRGKTLTLDQSNEVLNQVVRFGEQQFPWVLRVLIGGASKLMDMAIARMPELPAEYAATRRAG